MTNARSLVHVGVLPDGARRWSNRTGVPLSDAYRQTLRSVALLVAELRAQGCSEASVYCLSAANLGRSRDELGAIEESCDCVPETLGALQRDGLLGPVTIVGDVHRFPAVAAYLLPLGESPGREGGIRLNLLVGYDPWDELRAIAAAGGDLSLARLAIPRPVDAIVRSAGGVLLSGFLPMQSQYAQLIVEDKLWNDLTPDDLRGLARRACAVRHRLGL